MKESTCCNSQLIRELLPQAKFYDVGMPSIYVYDVNALKIGWFNTEKQLMCIVEDYPYQDSLRKRLKGKVKTISVKPEVR